jgi:hypothetical protein
MARLDERWHERLENWARYKAGIDAVSIRVSESYRKIQEEAWRDISEPPRRPQPLVGEALDTDRLVSRLDADHRQAVIVIYRWEVPETHEDRAALIGITRQTLHYRLAMAMQELERMQGERDRQSARMLSLVRT